MNKSDIKFLSLCAVGTFFLVFLVLGVMYVIRTFSAATVIEQVYEPEPGVHCLEVITMDGVAVDCWRLHD